MIPFLSAVMAGLVPAIHVFEPRSKTWIPGTRPGMTLKILLRHHRGLTRWSMLTRRMDCRVKPGNDGVVTAMPLSGRWHCLNPAGGSRDQDRRGATPRANHCGLQAKMPDDTTVIHGHATLEWGDQIRFVVRPYTKAFLKYMAIALPLYFAIWAFTQSDAGWVALRYEPLGSFFNFMVDVWPIYLGVGVVLVAVMVGRFCYVFARFPHVNRQLSYEVTAE